MNDHQEAEGSVLFAAQCPLAVPLGIPLRVLDVLWEVPAQASYPFDVITRGTQRFTAFMFHSVQHAVRRDGLREETAGRPGGQRALEERPEPRRRVQERLQRVVTRPGKRQELG